MIVSTFSVLDKDDRERIFQESFLLANGRPDLVFGIFFLIMSNAGINFQS